MLALHPVFHVSRLRDYTTGGGDGVDPAEGHSPVLVDGQEEYEVDRIVRERGQGQRKRFLVRFKGWGPQEDKWLTVEDLSNAQEVLKCWEANQKD